MSSKKSHDLCSECEAVAHGNLFCDTCRSHMNETLGFQLPMMGKPAEKPCGPEPIKRFAAKLESATGQPSNLVSLERTSDQVEGVL